MILELIRIAACGRLHLLLLMMQQLIMALIRLILIRRQGRHHRQLWHRLSLIEAMHVPLQPMVLLSQLNLLAARRWISLHHAHRDAKHLILLMLLLLLLHKLRVRLRGDSSTTASGLLDAIV